MKFFLAWQNFWNGICENSRFSAQAQNSLLSSHKILKGLRKSKLLFGATFCYPNLNLTDSLSWTLEQFHLDRVISVLTATASFRPSLFDVDWVSFISIEILWVYQVHFDIDEWTSMDGSTVLSWILRNKRDIRRFMRIKSEILGIFINKHMPFIAPNMNLPDLYRLFH